MIGTALAIGSVVSGLFGTIGSARANNKIDEQLRRRRSELDTWYDKEYNTPFLDTTQGKSAIQTLRTQYDDMMKKTAQNNAISGASDEMKVATADKAQRGYADSINKIAGYGTEYQDAIRREYTGQKIGLDNLEAQNLQGKSQNWSNLMSNAMNAGIGFAQADADGAFKDWDKKLSSLFKRKNTAIPSTNTFNYE
jgi:hypothetical protein